MGEKYICGHQDGGEISPRKLRCGGMCNTIGVDIFAMSEKIYGTRICGSGKSSMRNLLPCLLFGKSKTFLPVVGTLSIFLTNKAGLVPHNPVTSTAEKCKSLLRAIYEMIGAVMGKREFSTADNLWAVKEERWDKKKYQDNANDSKLR